MTKLLLVFVVTTLMVSGLWLELHKLLLKSVSLSCHIAQNDHAELSCPFNLRIVIFWMCRSICCTRKSIFCAEYRASKTVSDRSIRTTRTPRTATQMARTAPTAATMTATRTSTAVSIPTIPTPTRPRIRTTPSSRSSRIDSPSATRVDEVRTRTTSY